MLPGIGRAAVPCPPSQFQVLGGTSVSTPCPAQSYSTNFAGNESPLSEGGVWSHTGLDWRNVVKQDGFAFGTQTGLGGYDDSYAILSGFPPNQSASAVIYFDTNNIPTDCHPEVEILLRWADSAHNARGYECNLNSGGVAEIIRWNGPFGSFTEIDSGSFSHPKPKTGDILKATIVDNVITVFLNGQVITRAVDSTYADGNPGIGFFHGNCGTNTSFGFTNFTAMSL